MSNTVLLAGELSGYMVKAILRRSASFREKATSGDWVAVKTTYHTRTVEIPLRGLNLARLVKFRQQANSHPTWLG